MLEMSALGSRNEGMPTRAKTTQHHIFKQGNRSRNFRWFVFGTPKIVQVGRGSIGINRVRLVRDFGFYTWPDWEPIRYMSLGKRRWFDCEKPACGEEMAEIATKVAQQFVVPIRVDLYLTPSGIVLDELCVTPGLIKRISRRSDLLMGEWWQACNVRHQNVRNRLQF